MGAQQVVANPPADASLTVTSRDVEHGQQRGHSMEIYISHVLRIGVLVAATIILVGLILTVAGVGSSAAERSQTDNLLKSGSYSVPVSPLTIWRGVVGGHPVAIIQLGLLALILTPMTRVAMTAGLFLSQRDKIFVAITSVVFLVLVFGLVGVGS